MKLEIGNLATNEKKLLKGFKVLGVFPFYLNYINVSTHVRLCVIKEQLQSIHKEELKISDFHNSELQKKIAPLIRDYVLTGLINNRLFAFFFRLVLGWKLDKCGHYHLFNLYNTIQKLDDPSFFLIYWISIMKQDHTLLKVEKPS